MIKILSLLTLIILTSMFVFVAPMQSAPIPVLNRAILDVACSDMIFSCAGPVTTIGITAGDASSYVNVTTTWYITNWGADGKFVITMPDAGLYSVAPPTYGHNTDLTITPQTGYEDGWTRTNVVPDCYSPHWKLGTSACNSVGILSYNFKVLATTNAVNGLYTITFTQDFTIE
jgi:hypothetical protein